MLVNAGIVKQSAGIVDRMDQVRRASFDQSYACEEVQRMSAVKQSTDLQRLHCC